MLRAYCPNVYCAERVDGRVVMYYSDDGGETFELSESIFLRADESSVTSINEAGRSSNV